ncbi:universal stress protein [Nocardioides ferulae]|uniref:universal stress protein n=1 Tax=Nocardioides ferulae TaxID=2340821 RepID=UPI000EAB5A72|nr:universal stress protein [Nocardioides ferulae]
MSDRPTRIVVAVGDGDAEPLLRFAAGEALRSGSPLHLVHVLHMPPSGPESFVMAFEAAREIGTRLLSRHGARARELVGGRLAVTTELLEHSNGTVGDILELSSDARLVCLEHRQLHWLRRLASGSTTLGVAARSLVPVVSVPEGWDATQEARGLVSVGVDDPVNSDPVLRAAFENAAERGARLCVLHAWWLANGYDDVVVDNRMREDWSRRLEAAIEPALDKLRVEFPQVAVELVVRHAPIALALTELSAESDLLVLGRRHAHLPFGSHLGPVVRTLVRDSACPVIVVEPVDPPPLTRRDLATPE